MKQIPLTQWKITIVDDEDFIELNKYKWWAIKQWNKFYAARKIVLDGGKRRLLSIHSFLMNTQKWLDTDHINGDGLDNKRSNLRVCTRGENQMNRWKQNNNTSWFKWVCWHKLANKWLAYISINWKRKHLWYFSDKLEAYEAYCEACIKYHWEFAHL